MSWILLIAGVLAVSLLLLVASVVAAILTRRRSKTVANMDEMADLRDEVAFLREELERLREEVEQVKKGQGIVSSSQIKELG